MCYVVLGSLPALLLKAERMEQRNDVSSLQLAGESFYQPGTGSSVMHAGFEVRCMRSDQTQVSVTGPRLEAKGKHCVMTDLRNLAFETCLHCPCALMVPYSYLLIQEFYGILMSNSDFALECHFLISKSVRLCVFRSHEREMQLAQQSFVLVEMMSQGSMLAAEMSGNSPWHKQTLGFLCS